MSKQLSLDLPDPALWCTVKWASRRVGCSERSIHRLLTEGVLTKYSPLKLPGEQHVFLFVPEVERYAAAKLVVAGRA